MVKKEQIFDPKTAALPHQIEAISYIGTHQEVALFDEQGLGKTKIVIEALCGAMKKGDIEGVLVVAPMSLLYNWENEVVKHSFLLPIVLRGSQKEKRYKFLTGANFYITNYEAVIAELERIKRFCKSRKVAIVLDESARIKEPRTKTAEALFQLRAHSTQRIIITGTPVANKPIDLWAQFYFLDGGMLLGKDFSAFKERYNEKRLDYRAQLADLQTEIGQHSLRRCKDDVLELPEKMFVNIYVTLSGKQLKLYDRLREELRIEVQDMSGNTVVDEAENILKKLLRLTQIASNPYLIDKSYDETPSKFVKLDSLVREIVARGEKAIIWTSFVDNITFLKKRYRQHKPVVIYGEVPIKDRAEIVKAFQESDRNKLLIANPSAAREGLTLTRANNAIYVDRNFNLVDYLQSQDRIHRISQEKECRIYKILAKKSIDEYIDKIIDVKKDVAAFVQGDESALNPDSYEFLLNKSELLSVLGG